MNIHLLLELLLEGCPASAPCSGPIGDMVSRGGVWNTAAGEGEAGCEWAGEAVCACVLLWHMSKERCINCVCIIAPTWMWTQTDIRGAWEGTRDLELEREEKTNWK